VKLKRVSNLVVVEFRVTPNIYSGMRWDQTKLKEVATLVHFLREEGEDETT